VPLLAAYIVLVALCFAIINLIVDILYAVIDPRVGAAQLARGGPA
jgi:peptide/nickel transport system permease protein